MSINYAIVGGDKRIIELSKMLSDDGNIVYVYGLDKAEEIKNSKNIICCDSLDKALENSKIVIGPIPFSSNGKDINTPFSDKIISIDYLLSKINNKIFIAGSIKKEVYNLVNNDTKMIDIMNQEELTILNVTWK